jgi:hypothetical protein
MKTVQLEEDLVSYLTNVSSIAPRRPGFRFTSYEDFYLAHGHPYPSESFTEDEVSGLYVQLAKHRFEPQIKQCFYNAQNLALFCGLGYAEGYIATDDMPIPLHHGWAVYKGKPVDFTIRRGNDKTTSNPKKLIERASANLSRAVYYGIEFPLETIKKIWVTEGIARPVIDDWKNGFPLLRE